MSDLVLTRIRDRIATLTLNRPEKLNAFAGDMREAMRDALDEIARDPDVRVLVITGAGRGFCTGGDVKHMVGLKQRHAGFEDMMPLLEAGRAAVERIAVMPFPTVAAVNGPAAGGGLNLALACDLRIASDQAVFGESFVKIGLHIDWGGLHYLPRLVGLPKALELCWLGDPIDAAEALRIGLVNRVVPHASFEAEVDLLATRLAAAPQTSVRLAKQNLAAAYERTLAQSLDAEIEAQAECWASPDSDEGIAAFVAKRAPVFPGAPAATAASRFE